MTTPDLNLLLTLEALLEEGSVAGAARRLSLSPSAMSRALARLRRPRGIPCWCGPAVAWYRPPGRGSWANESAGWCRRPEACCVPSKRWIRRAWCAPFA